MANELNHIYEVLYIDPRLCQKLSKEGITTLETLLLAQLRLGNHDVRTVPEMYQKELCRAIRFIQAFEVKHNRKMMINAEFSEDSFQEFKKSERVLELPEASLLEMYKFGAHCPNSAQLFEAICRSGALPRLIKNESIKVCENMTPFLKSSCGRFDYETFAEKLVEAVLGRPVSSPRRTPFVVAGKTQSGKSAVKGVVMSMSYLMKYPLIVITKGVSESRELHAKLKKFAGGTSAENYTVSASAARKGGHVHWRQKQTEIQAAIAGGGTVVVADTYSQICKAIQALKVYRDGNSDKDRKFVVVVDECDAMFRTADRRQKFEQAYDCLMDMGPCLAVMISATPIPLMLELWNEMDHVEGQSRDIPLFDVEPTEEYMGLNEMKPIEKDGEIIYLDQTDLSYGKGYNVLESSEEAEEEETYIPYTNEKVKILYDDALSGIREGVLVLDCTCPRVKAPGNVKQKAERVQAMYQQRTKKDIVVVTYVGEGISVRAPGEDWVLKKGFRMDEVLEDIDKKWGLETPVFVFAFSKMRRGISYRSSRRVPTHFVILLGRGHNAMNVVQAMGRATFNGRSVLERNGFSHVTMLATSNDYTMAQKIQRYIEEISQRIKNGESFRGAMSGASQKMPDSTNFLRHTFREIGQLKGQRKLFKDIVSFDEPDDVLSPDEDNIRANYWLDAEAQRIFRALLELSLKEKRAFVAEDVCDAYKDTFREDGFSLNKTKMKVWLRKLVDIMLVAKEDRSDEEKWEAISYQVPFPKRLRQYINDDLAMTNKERVDGWEFGEAVGLCESLDDEASESDSSVSSLSYCASPEQIQQVSTSLWRRPYI
jgi:hypothetical protein